MYSAVPIIILTTISRSASPYSPSTGPLYNETLQRAVQSLSDAMALSANVGDIKSAEEASKWLIQLTGAWDSSLTSAYIQFKQSCKARDFMARVLVDSLPPASDCAEKALINQHAFFTKHHLDIAPRSAVQSYMSKSVAWARLRVSLDDPLTELPGDVTVISLHSDHGLLQLCHHFISSLRYKLPEINIFNNDQNVP